MEPGAVAISLPHDASARSGLLTKLALEPGRPLELAGPPGFGLTRLGYQLLAEPSQVTPVVALDVRGWMSPLAAWEAGVERDRTVIVRCPQPELWPRVTAALLEGVGAMLAEVPRKVDERDLRRLAALARARGSRLALRPLGPDLPSGVAHLRLRALAVRWEGADQGHGRLVRRQMVLEASGKGAGGMTRRIEVEDDGANALRVVSGLAAPSSRRAAG